MASTIIPLSENLPGRVSWKTNLSKIAPKFEAMGLKERILETQFRYLFIGAPALRFSGIILHQMLLRKTCSNSKESKEIKFLLNGEEVSFGMREYALVTGLNFGLFPDLNEEEEECPPLVVKYFKGNMLIRVSDLESSFLACPDKEDSWKMGLVLLVCQYLFSLDPRKFVNTKILSMVEDLDTFLQFPWGKVSFRATLKGINRDMKHHRQAYLSKNRATPPVYNVYGFALAFQVWIYEIIKAFVPKFAERVEQRETFCPRILLYTSMKTNTVPQICAALNDCVVTAMEESDEEKKLYNGAEFEHMTDKFDEFFERELRKRKHEEEEEE